MSADVIAAAPNPTAQPLPSAAEPRTHARKAGKDGSFGFRDLLDVINPLQHIPVVSAIYRRLTGDVPGNVAQLAGDTLFGGPIGLGAGLLGIAFKEETGTDPGEMALALVAGPDTATTASAAPTPPSAAPAVEQAANADPAPAPAPAAAALAPVVPTHPPIRLHRAPAAAPAPDPGLSNTSAAENAFLAGETLLRRGLTGNRAAPPPTRTFTAPIPLQLTGQAAQVMPLRALPRASTASPTPTPIAAPHSPPSDIVQRMQDALDRYRRLEAQRAGAVDVRQ